MTAAVSTRDDRARVELALEGMTCAACAARIERKLGKLEGARRLDPRFACHSARVTESRVARQMAFSYGSRTFKT